MSTYYELGEWLTCPKCGTDAPEYKYTTDDRTSVYECANSDCDARVEIT